MKSLLLGVGVALCAAGSSARAETVVYAIAIGNNAPPAGEAGANLRPLRYADDDAVRYFQRFSQLGRARLFAELDTQTQRRYPGLAGIAEPPTLANLRQVVAQYAEAMASDRLRGAKPVLYLAFSGHGARDAGGAAFLALTDGRLTQDVLYDEILARLPTAYSHVVVDACHAGGVVGVRGFFEKEAEARTTAVTADDALPILESQRLARFPHVGVFLATTVGQEAHEWSEIEAGVFTHELLSGLAGPADVNGDLAIEYTEAQAFVAAANRNLKDPRAVPRVIARPPKANQSAPLVSLPSMASSRKVTGKVGALGHFHIELENGQRYLDAHLAPGTTATLVVPDAGIAFLRTDTHEARLPAGRSVALADLDLRRRTVEARGSLANAYQEALFSAAYDRSYYQGYVDSIGAVGVSFSAPLSPAEVPADPTGRDRKLAIGVASVAVVSAGASIATGILAVRAKNDFESTDLHRPAHEAKERYQRYSGIAIATGITAVVAGVASYWLWPGSRSKVVPSSSGRGDYGLAVEMPW